MSKLFSRAVTVVQNKGVLYNSGAVARPSRHRSSKHLPPSRAGGTVVGEGRQGRAQRPRVDPSTAAEEAVNKAFSELERLTLGRVGEGGDSGSNPNRSWLVSTCSFL